MVTLIAAFASMLFAQQAVTPTPKPQFFAGVVSHIDAKRVNVSRTLPGRSPESRAFAIDGATKIPKGIKPRTRVTVRYQHMPEGDLALEIQIRTAERVTKAP
jgi:hypothetical protein